MDPLLRGQLVIIGSCCSESACHLDTEPVVTESDIADARDQQLAGHGVGSAA
jgi:hypothetical protein